MVSSNNNVTSFHKKTDGLNGRIHLQRKRKVVDENMKKYKDDDVNYRHNVQIEDSISMNWEIM